MIGLIPVSVRRRSRRPRVLEVSAQYCDGLVLEPAWHHLIVPFVRSSHAKRKAGMIPPVGRRISMKVRQWLAEWLAPSDSWSGWRDPSRLTMGRHSYGVPRVVTYDLTDTSRVYVGSFVSIAAGVTFLLAGNHRLDLITTSPMWTLSSEAPEGHNFSKGDIIVGDDVWIGRHATILSGVTIGVGAVIGACAVVASDVRPYAIVVGNPGREVRRRFMDAECDALLQTQWWEWPDDRIRQMLPLLRSSDVGSFVAASS
jgi:chloramphenicol O-acetyltransferase type B